MEGRVEIKIHVEIEGLRSQHRNTTIRDGSLFAKTILSSRLLPSPA
jgi:hypothetical protein